MKLTFLGAGSTVFAKNVLGDCLLSDKLDDFEISLYDIDASRLEESYLVISALRDKYKPSVKVEKTLDPVKAFTGADYIVNAIQVGGYEPCTVTDFEIPKKYGLRQTIADTLGIGGIFRGLRTINVMQGYADIMEKVCPNVLLLNYVNPMAIITGYMLKHTSIKTVGLCHSVQSCVPGLAKNLDMPELDDADWKIAGINHMAWLLELKAKDGTDLYPAMKKKFNEVRPKNDLVRLDLMNHFGYYNTESSEHTAEYHPYYIKERYPEFIEKYNIPLDEYPRRCVDQIAKWKKQWEEIYNGGELTHERSKEYGSRIIEACETGVPFRIHGNVLNTGLITNLSREAVVEVPIMVDRNGLNPCYVGALPTQLAALNNTNIDVQLMTIEAAATRKREAVYMAAYLDPHTKEVLSLDDIKSMCDDLFEAHGDWLPEYK